MIPPPMFPLHQPARPGLFRRTPPAIFPPVLGLIGLGLGWRKGAELFGLPSGAAEMLLGAVVLIWVFAVMAYGAKMLRRPAVVAEDLRILPGKAGLAAGVVSVHAMVVVLAPYAPALALGLLMAGLTLHLAFMALFVAALWRGPAEARGVTPAWHLAFVGPIVAALAAVSLGRVALAEVLFYATLPLAVGIWAISLVQLIRRIPPAPLRPMLAIHLAPASLFGTVAAGLGEAALALGFALLGAMILAALLGAGRWITAAGFSPLWGGFTFPLAAYAGLLLALPPPWATAGALVLVAATLAVPPIAWKVMQLWAKGTLAARTNAAEA